MEYFPGIAVPELTRDVAISFLRLFNDCATLLDSDRYFTKEIEGKLLSIDSPKNFKKWLFSLYLYDFINFEKFLNQLESFVSNSSVVALKDNLTNHPLNTKRVGFTKFESELEIMLENSSGSRLPLSNYGTGIQQLLYILAKLFISKSKIILIEELELNLSPEYQKAILEHLKNMIDNSLIDQVLLTTHSYNLYHRSDLTSLYRVDIQNGETSVKKETNSRRKRDLISLI